MGGVCCASLAADALSNSTSSAKDPGGVILEEKQVNRIERQKNEMWGEKEIDDLIAHYPTIGKLEEIDSPTTTSSLHESKQTNRQNTHEEINRYTVAETQITERHISFYSIQFNSIQFSYHGG